MDLQSNLLVAGMKKENDMSSLQSKEKHWVTITISGSIFGESLRWSSLAHKRAELRGVSLLSMRKRNVCGIHDPFELLSVSLSDTHLVF